MRLRLSAVGPQIAVPVAAGLAAICVGLISGIHPAFGILAAIGLGFVVVVFSDLAMGFAAMVLFAYMETLSTLESFSVAKVAGVVIAGSWLAVMTSGARDVPNPLRERPGLMYLLVLFIAWTAISIV